MSYQVVIYCPDRHIVYDGRTPYERGVGGGITARVRMARALARAGHQVAMVVNCPARKRIDGVEYMPLDEAGRLEGDVLIANTSGGTMSLRPLLDLEVEVALRVVWAHGTIKPVGLEETGFDCLYAVSNFVAGVAHREWGVPRDRIFVTYNAFEEELFAAAERLGLRREPYRLVYFSHPSKGLETAIAVLWRLRAVDHRFHLVAFGGPQLWGEAEAPAPAEEGVTYCGLVGHRQLAGELLQCRFSLHLQGREEPGALAIVDALRAGCILIGSPVGCYPEMVQDGSDGFLLAGDHTSAEVRDRAAARILRLVEDRALSAVVRGRAQSVPWDTDTMARVWSGHWDWWLAGRGRAAGSLGLVARGTCPSCGGVRLALPDGYHCQGCGSYARPQVGRGALH